MRLFSTSFFSEQYSEHTSNLASCTTQGLAVECIRQSSYYLLPPFNEQIAISNFLDRETRRIDALIEEKNCFIELLKEKRLALISQAVTKGLDPTVKMKDSGVEWLGEVPEHWMFANKIEII